MSWLVGHPGDLGIVAAKAVLIYVVALGALRLAQRRTLAQWTAIDFVAAVATGAIMGRIALDKDQSFLVGAVALLTLIAAHCAMGVARFRPGFAKLVDHSVRVLVQDGQLRRYQLRLCGLTDNDVLSQLRQPGHFNLGGLRCVRYETKGQLTVFPASEATDQELVKIGPREATGYDGS